MNSDTTKLLIKIIFALSISAVLWGCYSWMFVENYGMIEVDSWGRSWWLVPDYSQIISFRAPPNPQINMNDRKIELCIMKFIYELIGRHITLYCAVNLIMHLINCIILFLICNRLYHNRTAAGAGSLLFLCSPSSVFTVAQQLDGEFFCEFFILVSLYCHIMFCQNRRLWLQLVAVVACYLALRTKAYGYFIPVLILAYHAIDLYLWRPRSLPGIGWGEGARRMVRSLWPFAAVCLFTLVVTTNGMAFAVTHFAAAMPEGNFYALNFSQSNIMTHFLVYCRSFVGFSGPAALLVLVVPAGIAVWKRQRWMIFGLLASAIFFLPVVAINALRPYYSYVPSAFVFLALAGLVAAVTPVFKQRTVVLHGCGLAVVAILLLQIYALPWFRQTVDNTLYSVSSDRPFIDFMITTFKTLPNDSHVFVDGIDAPPGSSTGFTNGISFTLCFLYHDCSITGVSASSHEGIVRLYDEAPAPKLLVKLDSTIHREDWAAVCGSSADPQALGVTSFSVGDARCVARTLAAHAAWRVVSQDGIAH